MNQRGLVPGDGWRIVDRWWTPQPVERLFLTLEAPDGAQVCVGYDMQTQKWSLTLEAREEA